MSGFSICRRDTEFLSLKHSGQWCILEKLPSERLSVLLLILHPNNLDIWFNLVLRDHN